jgi:hypothetical protein
VAGRGEFSKTKSLRNATKTEEVLSLEIAAMVVALARAGLIANPST